MGRLYSLIADFLGPLTVMELSSMLRADTLHQLTFDP